MSTGLTSDLSQISYNIQLGGTGDFYNYYEVSLQIKTHDTERLLNVNTCETVYVSIYNLFN